MEETDSGEMVGREPHLVCGFREGSLGGQQASGRGSVRRCQALEEVGVRLWPGASSRPIWLEQQPDHGDRRQVGALTLSGCCCECVALPDRMPGTSEEAVRLLAKGSGSGEVSGACAGCLGC